MPPINNPSRRKTLIIIVFSAILSVIFVTTFRNHPHAAPQHMPQELGGTAAPSLKTFDTVPDAILSGHAIAPKLGNETVKAELGRAAWKLFHTVMARFPDDPTSDEKTALKSYIHLFQRLYPCGECAEHFGELLEKFPPQVSTRSAAAAWACHVHNEVNKSLDKELFNCAEIGDFYDCGCAEDEKEDMNKVAKGEKVVGKQRDTGHGVHRKSHLRTEG